jgi:G:T/U-mismatch repair DNA glycosylase
MSKKYEQFDILKEFIPKNEVNFIILGTMASKVVRRVPGLDKNPNLEDVFYYHDKRNRFWRALSIVLTGKDLFQDKYKNFKEEIEYKKCFLEKYGIAMVNIVEKIHGDWSSRDDVIFSSHTNQKIEFKCLTQKYKSLLETKPVFFTRYPNRELCLLLKDFLIRNKVDLQFTGITFLRGPTRVTEKTIANDWSPYLTPYKKK